MENIIGQNELDKHTIQRYRFKVLGSGNAKGETIDNEALEIDSNKNCNIVQNENNDQQQNQFVEELLKKSDLLSTNIIKLQMQIEKQESDFANRLRDTVAREKEISFDEGYEKSKAELEKKYQEKISAYIETARKLDIKTQEFNNFLKKLEKNLLDTSLEIAKEVVKKEILTSSSDIAIALAKELIKDLKDTSTMTIKTNPENYEALNEVFKDNDKVNVQSDDAVSIGGVVFLSEKGNLDGNLSARFEQIKQLLQNKSD